MAPTLLAQARSPRTGPAIDPRDHGVAFDGLADDTEAWRRAVAAADSAGLPIVCPSGTSLVTATIELPENIMLLGAGRDRTTIRVRNGAAHPSLYALRCRSGLVVVDLGFALVAEPGAGKWVAALGFADRASGMRFERLAFDGGASARGTFTGYIDNADVTDVRFSDCRFRTLEIAGVVKSNADRSNQRDWQWTGCRGLRCIDGINVNSPLGSWSHGRIADCDFAETGQFPFALAGPGCADWVLDVSGRDNDYELVHLEDGVNTAQIAIREAVRCNRKPGMLGAPDAANGVVSLLGGCHAIDVDITATLDDAVARRTAAVVAQAGGPRVSKAQGSPPSDITIRGRISLGAAGGAVTAFDGKLRFDDLAVEVRTGARRSEALFALSGCTWSGTVTANDPAILLSIDANNASVGAWDRIRIERRDPQVGLIWLAGVFPEQRNATPIARSITIVAPADAAGSPWISICPAPFSFEGTASIKRTGAVQSYALGRLTIRGSAIVRFEGTAIVRRADAPAGIADDGANEFRIVDGVVQIRHRPSGGAGLAWAPAELIALTLDGAFYPAVTGINAAPAQR